MAQPHLHHRLLRELNRFKTMEPIVSYRTRHAFVRFSSGGTTILPYGSRISDSSWRNIKARIKAAAEGRPAPTRRNHE